jgi:hypothetical protein
MRGSDYVGNPKEIKFMVSSQSSSVSRNAGIRLFDIKHNEIVLEAEIDNPIDGYNFISVTDFNYIPEEDSVIEVQLKGHKNKKLICYTLSIYY